MAKKRKTDVATSRPAVAKHFGVNERTVDRWLARGCPGKRGAYDLDAIAAWRAAHLPPPKEETKETDRGKYETELVRLRAAREQVRLDEMLGRLVDVSEPARHFATHLAEAVALLEQLPDRALSWLPATTSAADRKSLRARAQEAIDDVRRALATALDKQTEQMEDGDPAD